MPNRPGVEVSRQNHFDGEAIRRAGQAESHTGLHVEDTAGEIHYRVELVNLLFCACELVQWTEVGISSAASAQLGDRL